MSACETCEGHGILVHVDGGGLLPPTEPYAGPVIALPPPFADGAITLPGDAIECVGRCGLYTGPTVEAT